MADSNNEFFSEIKSEFKDLGSKVNRLFDELVRGKTQESKLEIKADVFETSADVVYQLDLPGFDRKDVTVQVRDNQLVVRGSRIRDYDDSVTILHREREFGEFERAFTLPANGDFEKVKAKFEGGNGVLTITIPKEIVEVETMTEINID